MRSPETHSKEFAQAVRSLAVGCALIALLFSIPLFEWVVLGLRSDTESYLLLIPPISLYLIWTRKESIPLEAGGSRSAAAAWGLAGGIGAALYLASVGNDFPLRRPDALTLGIAAVVCLVNAVAAATLGPGTRKALRFPLLFLFFSIPMPHAVLESLEIALQHSSAEVTDWLFSATQLPHLRDGLVFQLPGISIRVAQECSGVRSTLVLFITSIVGGYLMLNTTTNRIVLVLATWALGIFRNAVRILVIAWLCVEKGPHMISSPIHTHGGPLFFSVSLLPLGGLLWLMVRMESRRRSSRPEAPAPEASRTP
ncbi:MAG: exosortase [Verrucomicrobia bacterium]|nr:exosortase [Verrucomicrobiota bacterium]MBI3867948.1 exosortase [Verrucomicrobiota bacterium]